MISVSINSFYSEDTHLRAYFVDYLIPYDCCMWFFYNILGFLVGIIRLSSNWLFKYAYVYVDLQEMFQFFSK